MFEGYDTGANFVFGGDRIGLSDLGALMGGVTGAKLVSDAFCELDKDETKTTCSKSSRTLGAVFGGVGGAFTGAILVSPIGVFASSIFIGAISIDAAGQKQAEKEAAKNKDENSKEKGNSR